MGLRKTEEAERAFRRAGTNIDRMIPHLSRDDQKLALIALAAGLKEMTDGLAALSVAVRNVFDALPPGGQGQPRADRLLTLQNR